MLERLRSLHFFDEIRVIRIYNATAKRFNRKRSLRELLIRRECLHKYNWGADEFFLYKYESLTDAEKDSIVSEIAHSRFAESVNALSAMRLLADKWETFKYYGKFFRREACYVTQTNNGGGIMS